MARQYAPQLYDELRSLKANADRAARDAGERPLSQKAIETALRQPPYEIADFRGKLISEWLPPDPVAAKVPQTRSDRQVWALADLWSRRAGKGAERLAYWQELVHLAQHERTLAAASPRHGLTERDAGSEAGGARAAPAPLDPPYRQLAPDAPEVWMLLPSFGVVPYLGRDDLLDELKAWCAEDRPFSIGVIAGEGGSGKSRLAAELCDRMRASAWEAGLVSTTQALTEYVPEASTLMVVDYPEAWLACLGAALERLAGRISGPPVRVLLLARQPAARSHWWADVDRTSHRTTSLFTNLHRNLAEHPLSPSERREHAEAAMEAFGQRLGIEPGAVPDVTDDEFANPLLVHVAALLAVHGGRREPGSSRSVREDVPAHLLDRERNRWARLRTVHQLADLHETHAVRAVLAAVLTGPSADEVAGMLAALPEFSEAAQRERRDRIGYWLAELYPGEPLLASLGPDLLVEELLDSAALGTVGLGQVMAAVHGHGTTSTRHRSRMLATVRLAAERRPAVHSALRGFLTANLASLVRPALDDPDGLLATALDSALTFCGERKDPELALAFACAGLQTEVPDYHERGAQLLCTMMRLALPLFRGMADIDPDNGLGVLITGLSQLIHRYEKAGRDEEVLALSAECVRVRRQLVDRDPEEYLSELSFDLSNLASAHSKRGQHREALQAAEEAVALQRRLIEEGSGDGARLALAVHTLSGVQLELGRPTDALATNAESLPVLRRLAEGGDAYYVPVLAEALGYLSAILSGQHRYEEALAATTEAIGLRERHAGQRPDKYLPSLPYDLHNVASVNVLLGRYEDALAAAERAVAVGRRLTEANPSRHRTVLIRNLRQLARIHLRLNRPDDAIATAEEAVALSRRSTNAALAASLRQLVDLLTELDRHADALPVCREVEALLRQCAEPPRLAEPAPTLSALSGIQAALGRPDAALTAAQEAVQAARRLDVSEHSTLANALINLGDRYAQLGRLPEALEHTAEGVELLRAAGSRAELVPALARLADCHARLGHRDEAPASALEAVRLGEGLPRFDLIRDGINLAYALHVLGNIHLGLGRPEDGVRPLLRAVELYEQLADADDRYRPGLAAALHNLANIQIATGAHDAAVASCQRGAAIYERLADEDEDAYLGRFTGSLRDLRRCLATAERLEDALLVTARLVEVLERLVSRRPEFGELLAQIRTEFDRAMSLMGKFAQARRAAGLDEVYRRLAGEGPDRTE
ncbi:tetratricopeptide repeat protein [Embleya sp. NPDC020630]|uniref:tetratricopeptide repeat protein n=1 Tax=Embleya sp. NPDC020630 TaxID=3363979 RepID=UPI0037B5A22D